MIFSANLIKYRKRYGLTQNQLANQLGVTPQAVSKWENGSYPDADFFPKISEALGVSLDVLFGLSVEREIPDIEQLVVDEIKRTEPERRKDTAMHIFYAAMSAYNEYKMSKIRYPSELELETFAEMKTDHEMALARLNKSLEYFCFMAVPEKGVNSYADASPEVIRLFKMLASEEAIGVIQYLGSTKRNTMQSVKIIAQNSGIPEESVAAVISELEHFGLVWRVYAEIGGEPPVIYGYTHTTTLPFLLTIAKSLTNYIQHLDMYIDKWQTGPFRFNSKEE